MSAGAQAIMLNKGIPGFYFGLPAMIAQVTHVSHCYRVEPVPVSLICLRGVLQGQRAFLCLREYQIIPPAVRQGIDCSTRRTIVLTVACGWQEGKHTAMVNLGSGLGAGMVEAMVWTAPTERLKVFSTQSR